MWCLLFFIVVAIVFIIVWVAVGKGNPDDFNVPPDEI